MAEPVTVARPYAEAVFKLAREQDRLSQWSDMLALLEALVGDAEIRARIGDPNVKVEQLERLLLGVAGDRLDGGGRNYLQLLIANDRLALVPEIRTLYEALRREHEGVVEAKIVCAFPPDDAQLRALVQGLESKLQRRVSAEVEVDPSLIGGAKIVVGDKVIDATVRGKLEAMAAALTH